MSKQRKLPAWMISNVPEITKNDLTKTRYVAPVMYVMNIKELKEIANEILNEAEDGENDEESAEEEWEQSQIPVSKNVSTISTVEVGMCEGEASFQKQNAEDHWPTKNNSNVLNTQFEEGQCKPDLSVLDIFFKKN